MSLESCLISVLISSKARNNSEMLETGRGWDDGLGLGVCCAFGEESQTKTSGSCWVKQERSWGRNKLKGAAGCECGNQKIVEGKSTWKAGKWKGEGIKGRSRAVGMRS